MPCPEKCPVKEVLTFLSGAWTAEIYWNLRQGPLRFGELQRAVGGVSAKVLTQRLRDLEDLGVIDRDVVPSSPPQVSYSLTRLGQSFDPILDSMAEVGKKLIRKSASRATS